MNDTEAEMLAQEDQQQMQDEQVDLAQHHHEYAQE